MDVTKIEALARINARDGALDPEVVLKEAQSPASPLHDDFEWDDRKAGHAHRLDQARALIRAVVTILPAVSTDPIRAFVSLSNLRGEQGGSYIATATVLSDAEMYAQARADGITALLGMQKRFSYIAEFNPIWEAVASVVAQLNRVREPA